MVFYQAYDLSVESDCAVPGLVQIPPVDSPDITLSFDRAMPAEDVAWHPWFEGPARTAAGRATLVAHRSADATRLRFAFDAGPVFTMDAAARHVRIGAGSSTGDPTSGAWPYLLGPVFGIVLRLRGVACLHASAVVIDGEACVFVGAEGMGKSTLAAQFAAEGAPVLTDDVVALRARSGRWFVAPGSPRVRLWNDAVAALPLESHHVAPPANGSARFQLDVARAGVFAEEARPVARLYVLEYDAALRTPVIEPMTATDALPWLSANTFAQRVLSREQRAEEFSALADLVASVPVRRLRRPDTIAHLAATTAAVRRDATPADASASKRIAAYGRTFDVRIVDRPEGPAPIEITERYVSAFRTGADRPMLRAGLTANGSHVLDYWDGTRCTIDARGQQLFLESPPRVGDPDEFLFGLGLAFALRLRGELCVHAAAVNINGEAVLLAGLPRAGKSTFAAALQALGQQALTDDVCVLDLVRGRPFVQAGPRRLRLRADTTELLERALGHPMTFVQAPDGRQVDVLLPRGDQAAPVRGIYWLDRTAADGEAPRIQLLSAADAVIKLVSDTWGARLLDREMRQQEFDRACRVIACVRTRIVRYANGPAGLADAARELVREVVEAQGVE